MWQCEALGAAALVSHCSLGRLSTPVVGAMVGIRSVLGVRRDTRVVWGRIAQGLVGRRREGGGLLARAHHGAVLVDALGERAVVGGRRRSDELGVGCLQGARHLLSDGCERRADEGAVAGRRCSARLGRRCGEAARRLQEGDVIECPAAKQREEAEAVEGGTPAAQGRVRREGEEGRWRGRRRREVEEGEAKGG